MTTGALARRIEKAAAQVRAGGGNGCAVCASWPKWTTINDRHSGPADPHPVRCPSCGRQRVTVEWVHDWRKPA